MVHSSSPGLHIVGVGASAGGLEAMVPLFARMRPTGRVAYVVAQHMAKNGHDELVVKLINRESALPVVLAGDDQALAADTVYLIPSGRDGVIKNCRIALHAPGHLSTPSVNALFTSLAAMGKGAAIGIVLSGAGADGTVGCRAIKAAGGLTIAQLPAEAKYDGMPSAAIDAGVIDETLPVAAIGERLASRYATLRLSDAKPLQAAVVMPGRSVSAVPPAPTFVPRPSPAVTPSSGYEQLLKLVHQVTQIDFSSYKEDTLLRRLDKRLATLGIASLDDYLAHARKEPDEIKTLQHMFLVSVSSFFRDGKSFAALRMSLAQRLAGKPAGEPVRVWVPGCASGEEALTLAILLRELSDSHPVEIVGTDLNPEALAIARVGSYRQTAFKEMDGSLRDRHFQPHGQHYQANSDLLSCIRFEQRDVLAGAPLQSLDLVSCRNLLIYMKSELQDELITCFHRALHSQGLLFIGQSESLSVVGNSLFVPIDHYHRLFRRRH